MKPGTKTIVNTMTMLQAIQGSNKWVNPAIDMRAINTANPVLVEKVSFSISARFSHSPSFHKMKFPTAALRKVNKTRTSNDAATP